jgi:AcrR family transcriptional regulator
MAHAVPGSEEGELVDARIVRTRRALLDAAVELVEDRDVASISIADIAREAGVSRQVVYAHYPDRDHLLADAAVRRWADVISAAEDGPTRIPADGSAPETLVALVEHVIAHTVFYRRLFTGSASALVLTELDRHHRYHFERLMRLPTPAASRTTLTGIDDSELVTFLAGGSVALVVDWTTNPRPEDSDPREMANRLWRLWMSLRPIAT